MNLQEIAKELKKKAEQRDKKGILKLFRLLKYDFDLGSLQPKLDNLISEVKNWKWPSLTGKFNDKENLKKWANGEPVPPHRTIIDDICGFTELLRGKAQENLTDTGQNGGETGERKKPDDLITFLVAVKDYQVSRATLKRRIADGDLKSYRSPKAAKNSPHLISRTELEQFYTKKS